MKDILPHGHPGATGCEDFNWSAPIRPSDLKGPNVECPGFVDDLAPYLRRANLVIAPMPFAHGMATKIVLALAFGKTVLSTPEGRGRDLAEIPATGRGAAGRFSAHDCGVISDVRPPVDAGEFRCSVR